jgi:hypothetical protein
MVPKTRGFKVRDFRQKQFFIIDDIYLNGFAKQLGVTTSMIYISLCRHADKDQQCFPSQKLIAEELNLNERTVMEKLKILRKYHLVEVVRVKSKKGKWVNNIYTLLDKIEWIKPSTYIKTTGGKSTYIKTTKPPTVKLQYKDTHKKYTHNRILEDEIFKRLQTLDESTDKGARLSPILREKLNQKYPLWKHDKEWAEVKALQIIGGISGD